MKILMVSDYNTAKNIVADTTVEAEYGDAVVEGKVYTLAHHGSRSNNPAPCNASIDKKLDDANLTILISHIDLDTVGGIAAIRGIKAYDNEFWSGAEFVDVNGPHHIHELPEYVQNKLNAYWAWTESQPQTERLETGEIRDVTKTVLNHIHAANTIIAGNEEMLEAGKKWAENMQAATDEKLVYESDNVRAFVTDGIFCNAAYYSKKRGEDIPCTISFNTKYKSITIAFFDGGKELDACKIVQSLWGNLAGGHAGIAGSPREKEMNIFDFVNLIDSVEDKIDSERARELWKVIGRI